MRIGIDARSILNPERGDAIGSGHYTYQLIRHLLEMDTKNEYVLFFDFRVREQDVQKFSRPNVKVRFYPFSDYKKYLPGAYSELLGTATLRRERLDVLHATSPSSRIPIGYSGKTVVTFHDMAPFVVPECLPRFRRSRDKAICSYMAKKADRIIAVSSSIKDALVSQHHVLSGSVKVVYSAVDRRFFNDSSVDINSVKEKFGISKKYILFLGTLEPSKNISRLLEAFAIFKEQRLVSRGGDDFDWQLVLGGKRGWLSQEYPRLAKDLGVSKDVVWTGYVVGDDLVPLFKGSDFFVMPSLYEGFGMTALEALATQTPSIVSDIPTMREIVGQSAHFVDPKNVTSLVDAFTLFSESKTVREDFCQKGFIQAKKFDWKKTAQETLAVYEDVVGK
ncbi:MAG: glycosyltransferase family 4 protein [Candidatus Moranbacteria bacterium]|nr:glycosyltransferase family 4 protein [Candidatus Moranbacteria bacterium]